LVEAVESEGRASEAEQAVEERDRLRLAHRPREEEASVPGRALVRDDDQVVLSDARAAEARDADPPAGRVHAAFVRVEGVVAARTTDDVAEAERAARRHAGPEVNEDVPAVVRVGRHEVVHRARESDRQPVSADPRVRAAPTGALIALRVDADADRGPEESVADEDVVALVRVAGD
jgi:hypothetical protein